MGELVNLRHVRKRQSKKQTEKQAELNRIKFGRTKLERNREAAQAAHADKTLDQHKLSREDGT